jgi:hypothetical protein
MTTDNKLTSRTINACRSYTPLDTAKRVLHVLKVHCEEIEQRGSDLNSAHLRAAEPLLQAGLESIRRDPPKTAVTTLRSIVAAYRKAHDIATSANAPLMKQHSLIAESVDRLEHALETLGSSTITFEEYRYRKWLPIYKIRHTKAVERPTATTSVGFGFVQTPWTIHDFERFIYENRG